MIMKHETESGFAIPFNITPQKYKEEGQQPNKPYQTFEPMLHSSKLFKISKDPQRMIERVIAAKQRESISES